MEKNDPMLIENLQMNSSQSSSDPLLGNNMNPDGFVVSIFETVNTCPHNILSSN